MAGVTQLAERAVYARSVEPKARVFEPTECSQQRERTLSRLALQARRTGSNQLRVRARVGKLDALELARQLQRELGAPARLEFRASLRRRQQRSRSKLRQVRSEVRDDQQVVPL